MISRKKQRIKILFFGILALCIAFAIVGILAIEAGLLTPPFGLLVYTVKAAIQDENDNISIMQIFRSSTPYWIIMLTGIIAITSYPQIATYLPSLMF